MPPDLRRPGQRGIDNQFPSCQFDLYLAPLPASKLALLSLMGWTGYSEALSADRSPWLAR